VVQLLLDAHADVDAVAHTCTALHTAAGKGYTGVVQLLLTAQADINAADILGRTALFLAATDGHTGVVQLLLAASQLSGNFIPSAVRVATSQGHTELAIMVLKDLLSRDRPAAAVLLSETTVRLRYKPLAAEVLRRWQAVSDTVRSLRAQWPALQQLLVGISTTHQQLRVAAADITAAAVNAALQAAASVVGEAAMQPAGRHDDAVKAAALHVAPSAPETALLLTAAAAAAKSAVKAFANPSAPTTVTAALHRAAASGDIQVLQALLCDAQAPVDAADKAGWTALHKAAYGGHAAVVQLLLDAGAAVHLSAANGHTALHSAARKGHTAVVKLLLAAKADVNAAAAGGKTALYLAAEGGHTGVVGFLLAAPQLAIVSMLGAAGAAAAAGHTEPAVLVLQALMSRDGLTAAAELAGQQPLAAEVLRQWEAAEGLVRQLEARWPALRQLLIGVLTTHKQLQAAAADIKASSVRAASSALQAGSPVVGEAECKAVVVAAASAAAVAAVADIAPMAHDAAAAAAVAAAACSSRTAGDSSSSSSQL
jgi:ankyrin repeat protein